MDFFQKDVDNQDENSQDKEWTNRKMPSCEEDIPNHIIIVWSDEAFGGGASKTNDDCSQRYASIGSLFGQFQIPCGGVLQRD